MTTLKRFLPLPQPAFLALACLALACAVFAPGALAKKDLFATEPGAKQPHSAEQILPARAATNDAVKNEKHTEPEAHNNSSSEVPHTADTDANPAHAPESKTAPPQEEQSAIDAQLARLKRNLIKTKDDLFGKKEAKSATMSLAPEPSSQADTIAPEETKPEAPSISATEAAQRAQALAEGQVINVRKYQTDDKTRYAVKLLQKNGRMKTITLDAISGQEIEETAQ